MSTQPPPADTGSSTGERIGRVVLVAVIAFLAFVGGGWAVLSKTFPYEFLKNAYRAGEAWSAQRALSGNVFKTDLWRKARGNGRGVTVHEPSETFAGYTLYTSGDGASARLISMDGQVVHEWRKPFSEIWNALAAVKRPQPDNLIYMNRAKVLPDGNLLAIYTAAGDTPWGYGMVKLDKDSNVLWSYLQPAHHDFDVAPDGRIFVLTQEFTSERLKDFPELGSPRLDDFLVVLSPEGKELKKISLTKALARSRYARYLHAVPAFALEDPLHANTANYIGAAEARNLRVAQEGHVLTAFRDLGVIAAVDPESEQIIWATQGPWLGFHDPQPLPNGHILLLDNLGGFQDGPGNDSRVIEFDPATMRIDWEYTGDAERRFFTEIRGSAERLPNGNTLITEDDGGRILEVDHAGKIVWEYVNPVRATNAETGESYVPIVTGAQRIPAGDFAPGFRAVIENRKETRR